MPESNAAFITAVETQLCQGFALMEFNKTGGVRIQSLVLLGILLIPRLHLVTAQMHGLDSLSIPHS